MSTTNYTWDDDTGWEPRDRSRSRAARKRTLQRKVTRWDKYGDDFRKAAQR